MDSRGNKAYLGKSETLLEEVIEKVWLVIELRAEPGQSQAPHPFSWPLKYILHVLPTVSTVRAIFKDSDLRE